jgi:hypothetical protein
MVREPERRISKKGSDEDERQFEHTKEYDPGKHDHQGVVDIPLEFVQVFKHPGSPVCSHWAVKVFIDTAGAA